jgi:hypothetical protein
MSTVTLIMLPKVLAFYGIYGGDTARRGARSGTHVSGIQESVGDPRTTSKLEAETSLAYRVDETGNVHQPVQSTNSGNES